MSSSQNLYYEPVGGQNSENISSPPRRLCSEIQLFDLCELDRCRYKDGKFCTDSEMLARFEAIAEPQDRPMDDVMAEDDEDDELYDGDYCDDGDYDDNNNECDDDW